MFSRSPFHCPNCSGLLSICRGRADELFCLACRTGASIQGQVCFYTGPNASGDVQACDLERLSG